MTTNETVNCIISVFEKTRTKNLNIKVVYVLLFHNKNNSIKTQCFARFEFK